jgi:gliding motility-associated-like protein
MPLCNGNANGIVTLTPSGGVAPYQYSLGGTTFQSSNSFSSLPAGVHLFRIKDNVGCTKDTTITLTEPAVLTTSSSNTATAGCSNNDGVITATALGGTSPYIYTISPAANTSGASTGIFTGLATGTYTTSVRDAKGCVASSVASVVLVDNMFLSLGPDTTICVESSITFQPQVNPEASIFSWTSLNAPASTIANPAIKNAVATPTDTAIYVLNAKWGTCQRTDSILVNVLHKPVPNAGADTAICNLTYAILRGSASNTSGPVNYNWAPITGMTVTNQPVVTVAPARSDTTYTYTLTVTDNYGCRFSVTDAVKVRVQPPVPAFAGKDTIAVKNVPHQLSAGGGYSYIWSPSYPLNGPFNQNPLAILQNDTKFIVQVTDVAGCIGYDTVFIKTYVGPTYYIPNAFTPNGDGLNDVFRPIPVGMTNTEWFRVFNRYGQIVFQTNQWLKGWDGTYRGKKQPVGAYVWMIKGTDRDGKVVEMKGTVMLVQ